MDFLQPTTWADALAVRAERPDALPIAGATDVMVELDFDRRRPGALLDPGPVRELRDREVVVTDGHVRNPSFTDYLFPTFLVPGVGEPPTISSGPAVVAAVPAATGRKLRRVPIRQEHITGA